MVLSYISVIYFSINLCGVEDSVENYQSYLISCFAVMVFESYGILSFLFCHSYLDLSHYFHAQIRINTKHNLKIRLNRKPLYVMDNHNTLNINSK